VHAEQRAASGERGKRLELVVKEQRGARGAEEKASAELGPGAGGAGQRRVCQDPFHRQSRAQAVAFPDRPRGFNISVVEM
jgi:hypothetical protein